MKRFPLSRRERITRTTEFRSALHKSAFYAAKSLKLGVSPNGLGFSRIGVSLRRENFRLAVERNRLRRRIKEAFRLNKDNLAKGYDIIAVPCAMAAGLDFDELSRDFVCVAEKAGILLKRI